jgi:hypothetical protein
MNVSSARAGIIRRHEGAIGPLQLGERGRPGKALRLLEEHDSARAAQLAEFDRELGCRLATIDRSEVIDPAVARARLQRKSEQRRKPHARERLRPWRRRREAGCHFANYSAQKFARYLARRTLLELARASSNAISFRKRKNAREMQTMPIRCKTASFAQPGGSVRNQG